MAKIKIKTETFPERCEICHQADFFDPEINYCSRCSDKIIPISNNDNLSSPDSTASLVPNRYKDTNKEGIFIGILITIVGTLTGTTVGGLIGNQTHLLFWGIFWGFIIGTIAGLIIGSSVCLITLFIQWLVPNNIKKAYK